MNCGLWWGSNGKDIHQYIHQGKKGVSQKRLTPGFFWLPFVDSFRTELLTHFEEIFILFGMFPQEGRIEV